LTSHRKVEENVGKIINDEQSNEAAEVQGASSQPVSSLWKTPGVLPKI